MAWTYSDWPEQASDTTRLSRLRQHISEVQSSIGATVSAQGSSRDTSVLKDYVADLRQEEMRLLRRTNGTAGGVTKIRHNRI